MKYKIAPISVVGSTSAAGAAQVTLTVRKGTAKAEIQILPRGKAGHKSASFALVDGVLYSLLKNTDLLDFTGQLESNEFVSGFMDTPLAMGYMPVFVKEKVRQCIVAVVARDTQCKGKLDREVLTVATLLASLRELWDAEEPGRGDAILQTVARAAMGDLLDRKPKLAQEIKNLLGWGNDDEQSEDQVRGLRKTVKKQLRQTTQALRLMRDNPLGGPSTLVAGAATNPSSTHPSGN